MSEDVFERTRKLIGEQALSRLSQAYVAVFGIGGVGSYAVEALAGRAWESCFCWKDTL